MGQDLGEQGGIYCGKYFIWEMLMIFLILKCVTIFFFQKYKMTKKSFHKFLNVAACHILGPLVDVFATEVEKTFFTQTKKNLFSPKVFLTADFFGRSANFFKKNGLILMIFDMF